MNPHLLDTRPKDGVAKGIVGPPATAQMFNRDNNTTTSSAGTAPHTHLDLSLGMSLTSGAYSSAVDHDRSAPAKAGASTAVSMFSYTSSGLLRMAQQGSSVAAKRLFSESVATGGFVHPWSLAARQEQARLKEEAAASTGPPPSTSSISRCPQPTPAVGWPPVRTHRKNILNVRPSTSTKEEGNDTEEKEAKKSKTSGGTSLTGKSTMFVKVNVQGFPFGRK